MTCPSCGASVDDALTNCTTCGASLPTSGTTGAHGPPVPPRFGASPPAPHPSGLGGEVRGWAIAAHLSGLGIGLSTVGVLGFVGPLFVWLLKREEHGFLDHHGKEALNFQLTVLVAVVAATLLAIPAAIVGVLTLGVGLILMALVALAAGVVWFVLPIVAAVRASNGEGYRYPISIRFVR